MWNRLFCRLVEWDVAETSILKHSPSTRRFVIKSFNQSERPLTLLLLDNLKLKALFLFKLQKSGKRNPKKELPNGRSKAHN